MDIALIGGHGKVALLTEPLLTQAGFTVDAIIRNPDQSADVEATGARPVVADIETLDAAGWDRLLAGKDAVIWAAGAGGGDSQRTWAVDRDAAIASMDAADRGSASRYVMVSYFGAGPDHGVPEDDDFYPYAQAKTEADAHLAGTNLAWTILRPSALTSAEPSIHIDAGATKPRKVSRGNVAFLIAEVVGRGDLSGVTVAFNDGDTNISDALDEAAESD